jgi:AraC-like DNA-binding protein
MKLYIKFMVSLRCKMIVKEALQKLGISYTSINLGVVEMQERITCEQRDELNENLMDSGLELLDDKKSILIEKIKRVAIETIHYADELPNIKYSEYLSQKLGYNYTYLAKIFSEVQGMTIQQYVIVHKIEKVKELLLYDELSITEIAYKMSYSSVAHLSRQFKKITGLTPGFFRKLKDKKRINLEDI